ncbi:hypothetical protein [Hymenobacter cavernae]|uniref:Uncharacterized protein n=1 Tax=Hymenobacter cavernae TaxID=2044852 RepID=A0ABQ1TPF7_9BACT|nr:hypothetical protein [Hymenobacter cavernae]GGE98026.1 hypothetical protein GCM10011383_06000 [Hymenobacter cavernae]
MTLIIYYGGGLLGGLLVPRQAFTDEVAFTGSLTVNGTTTGVTPTLSKARAGSNFFTISGTTATGVVATGDNTSAMDASVIVTFPSAVTSFTITYRNA